MNLKDTELLIKVYNVLKEYDLIKILYSIQFKIVLNIKTLDAYN